MSSAPTISIVIHSNEEIANFQDEVQTDHFLKNYFPLPQRIKKEKPIPFPSSKEFVKVLSLIRESRERVANKKRRKTGLSICLDALSDHYDSSPRTTTTKKSIGQKISSTFKNVWKMLDQFEDDNAKFIASKTYNLDTLVTRKFHVIYFLKRVIITELEKLGFDNFNAPDREHLRKILEKIVQIENEASSDCFQQLNPIFVNFSPCYFVNKLFHPLSKPLESNSQIAILYRQIKQQKIYSQFPC